MAQEVDGMEYFFGAPVTSEVALISLAVCVLLFGFCAALIRWS